VADRKYLPEPHTAALRKFAKSMRHTPTEVESNLWALLRNRRFAGYKFRRQMPLGTYIVDFACLSAKLIVEADGSQHADDARDTARDAYLTGQGFRVLRFWNNDILSQQDSVMETIWAALQNPSLLTTPDASANSCGASITRGDHHA
jgi:very-short-patch-repair endonuclease